MAKSRSTSWGYALSASTVLLLGGAAALLQAGIAADEGRLGDGILPALWLVFGTGLLGLVISLPSYVGHLRNERIR
ncbi:hypothetical protein N2K95_10775 [Arthrobacter zhaoxinii]|uniref:Uncharacterized protein n=1 Tax=Arthrobacter zhaoxinii TaxID=2964616 RepID=A0ABY5YM56_9MICC|nr:hypothetical protein [Arthrobacter zhaoxinii]UWX96156.1 hypothetical protein N2K95_10775 [Arthrobacter zhaoxinii]